MDFFNKIGDLANKAGKKTGDLTKEAKIKMKMSENKSKIDEIYKEIGKLMYQKHIDSAEFNEDDITEFCEQIDNLSKEIEEYQNDVRRLKNKRICENCKAEIDLNIKFCPHCGTEQPEEEPKDEVLEAEIVDEDKEEDKRESEKAEEVKEETENSEPSE